jgi:uncharacterized protein
VEIVLCVVAAGAAFVVSATFGLGGSLILVPTLALLLGAKQGIALAALLLALNNLPKLVAYRRVVPWRASARLAVVTATAVAVGALGLVALPEHVVRWAVLACMGATAVWELSPRKPASTGPSTALAAASGLTSGVAGTSGPLKGLALRALGLPRAQLVGAASVVSLAGDVTKAAVFTQAGLLTAASWLTGLALVPLMIGCTILGRRCNGALQERAFAVGFWAVMAGYAVRLVA